MGSPQSAMTTATTRDDAMLVLTRKLMEKLYIGDEICVTVVRLEGGQVRLGIDAPREIAVVRGELTVGGARPPRATEIDPDLKTRPALVRGIDTRRRGPSR